MADSEAVTCEVCLRPYAPPNLFSVPIGSDMEGKGRLAVVCKSCATEIAAALAATRKAKLKSKDDEA